MQQQNNCKNINRDSSLTPPQKHRCVHGSTHSRTEPESKCMRCSAVAQTRICTTSQAHGQNRPCLWHRKRLWHAKEWNCHIGIDGTKQASHVLPSNEFSFPTLTPGRTHLLVRNLEQLEHDRVRTHVAQEALLVFARFVAAGGRLHAQPRQTFQDLLDRAVVLARRSVYGRSHVQVNGRALACQALQTISMMSKLSTDVLWC